MSKLNHLGITVGINNKAEIVFDSLFDSFLKVKQYAFNIKAILYDY